MHEARAARPAVLGQGVGHHGHVAQLGHGGGRSRTQPSMYRSCGRRPPQYSVAGRVMPLCCMCSISALMGAKPVPEARKTMGLSESSRRKKLPNGPSTRRISFSFMSPNTWVVNLPPGMWRMCSSTPGALSCMCGAVAME